MRAKHGNSDIQMKRFFATVQNPNPSEQVEKNALLPGKWRSSRPIVIHAMALLCGVWLMDILAARHEIDNSDQHESIHTLLKVESNSTVDLLLPLSLLTVNNQTFAGNGSTLNSTSWSAASGSSCDPANQTNAFIDGNNMMFCAANGIGVVPTVSMIISGITADENFTLSGTYTVPITNLNNGIATIDVASGKLLDLSTQQFGNSTSAGYIKNGSGVLAFSGGSYTGGFTLNAGTFISRSGNAFGNNPSTGIVTLNAGTIAAASTPPSAGSFFGKFSTLIFGGDIQFGITNAPSSINTGMSFTDPMSLGNVLRTLTLGNSGTMFFGGIISNTGANGITFTANSSGLGRFEITNSANTFTGPITLNGTGSAGLAEVRFMENGSLGNAANTININGGRLASIANTSFTIAGTHSIQVGNTPGTSISVSNSGTLTYNSPIADLPGSTPGSWSKQGAGILSLGGASTYTGSTTINSGTLLLTTGSNRLPETTTLNLGQTNSANLGTLDLNGNSQQIAGLNSLSGINPSTSNNIVNSISAATLTFSGSDTYHYGDGTNANSGILTGAIALVKTGSGTQTLGDANTYTGSTTISDGELRFNPSVNTSLSGALSMNGGILGTRGIASTRTLTFSSFSLSNDSKIDISPDSSHTLAFTTTGTFSTNKTTTIFGWQGTSGMPGTKGRIFFGNSAASLTPAQLAQIIFNDGTIEAPGANAPALILSNGEIVPDEFINNAPTIVMNVVSTSDYLDGGLTSSPPSPYALSGTMEDPTDPFSMLGVDFTVNDAETGAASLVVTGSSSNTDVVTDDNIVISGTGATRNAKVIPSGIGYADLSITVSDGSHTATYIIKYAASDPSVHPSSTRFFTDVADASTAQAIDDDYMMVGDDQNQVLRLYNRHNSGLPVKGFDYSSSLGISMTNPEVDIEGSLKSGNRIYWLGSHSNADTDGALRPNRYRLFATDIIGSGASTTLTYVGRYDGLRTDLLAWDAGNGHGLGTNYFGLAASAADGVIPEAPDGSGFNIEGMILAPDNITAYICFRAPIAPASNRTKALVVPVTNLADLVSGNPSTGPATFGAPILLDLDGLGIRDIMRNASGQYLILAGPADGSDNFKYYRWTGNVVDDPEPRSADLASLLAGGSFESLLDIPDPLTSESQIPLLVDNGVMQYYGDGIMAHDLPDDHHKKFRSESIALGCATKVTNANDTGSGSLRDVIECVPENATIHFVNSMMGNTITLTSGEIVIDKNLTISGPGLATDLSISGASLTRIFHVMPGKTLLLKNMSLMNANAPTPYGGAIYVEGNLTLENMLLTNNFEDAFTPKSISINSPGGLIEIIGSNVQIKQ